MSERKRGGETQFPYLPPSVDHSAVSTFEADTHTKASFHRYILRSSSVYEYDGSRMYSKYRYILRCCFAKYVDLPLCYCRRLTFYLKTERMAAAAAVILWSVCAASDVKKGGRFEAAHTSSVGARPLSFPLTSSGRSGRRRGRWHWKGAAESRISFWRHQAAVVFHPHNSGGAL